MLALVAAFVAQVVAGSGAALLAVWMAELTFVVFIRVFGFWALGPTVGAVLNVLAFLAVRRSL